MCAFQVDVLTNTVCNVLRFHALNRKRRTRPSRSTSASNRRSVSYLSVPDGPSRARRDPPLNRRAADGTTDIHVLTYPPPPCRRVVREQCGPCVMASSAVGDHEPRGLRRLDAKHAAQLGRAPTPSSTRPSGAWRAASGRSGTWDASNTAPVVLETGALQARHL